MTFAVESEREIYRGRPISVVVASVRAPDGRLLERSVVRHPGAVAVVPLHDDDSVSLVAQYRAPVDQVLLEAPAGTCDVDGEPAEETARRELAEEAGLEAERLELLATFFNSPGFCDQRTSVYLATGLRPCATGRSSGEEQWMEVRRVPLDEVPALVEQGRIVDGQTLIGLELARSRGRRGRPGR